MKKITILLTFIIVNLSYGQLKINSSGFHFTGNGYHVIEVRDKSASFIYSGLLDYVNKNFRNPDKVIQAKTENTYLRITFVDENMANYKSLGVSYDLGGTTTLELDIKDGKFRINQFTPVLNLNGHPFTVVGGMSNLSFYNKKLKPKKQFAKTDLKIQIENYYNNLFKTIANAVITKDDDW